MSSSRTIGTITLEGNSTHANIGTQIFPTSMMPASTSTHKFTLSQCMGKEQSVDVDIGQINLHLSNVNKSLLVINTGKIDISDGDITNMYEDWV